MSEAQIRCYSWIINLISAYPFSYMFITILNSKWKNQWLSMLLYAVFTTGTSFILKEICQLPIFFITLFSMLSIYISLLIAFQGTLIQKFKVLIFVIILSILAEIMGAVLLQSLSFEKYGADKLNSLPHFMAALLSNMMILCFSMLITILWKTKFRKLLVKESFFLILFPLYQLILLLIYFSQATMSSIKTTRLGLFMITIGIFFNILVIRFVENAEKKQFMEQKLTELYKQNQIEKNYYQLSQTHIADIKQMNQEFSSQLQLAYNMMKAGNNPQDIKQVLDTSYHSLHTIQIKQYCENSVVNALLTMKAKSALANNIVLRSAVDLPDTICIERIDLCSLFGNLLDNAIEAAETAQSAADEIMSIEIHASIHSGFLVIKTSNPSAGSLPSYGKTNKSDSINHGYGLLLINRIVKFYQGKLNITQNNNLVTVTAVLKI